MKDFNLALYLDRVAVKYKFRNWKHLEETYRPETLPPYRQEAAFLMAQEFSNEVLLKKVKNIIQLSREKEEGLVMTYKYSEKEILTHFGLL